MEIHRDMVPPAAILLLLILSCCSCSSSLQSSLGLTQPECRAAAGVETEANGKPTCKFPAIFNFGDSNSDTGGYSAAFGQVGSPSGETFFHTPMGRYCDGRLKIDFIAQSLGLPYLNAFLDAVGSNFTHGANFATAGSTVRHQNNSYSPISLNYQSNQFNDFQNRSQIFCAKSKIFKNLLPQKTYFSSALYTFDIGQNDLTAGYFQNMTTDQVRAFVPDVLAELSKVIKSVYEKGGRYFWIHNTGPVGCLPYIRERLLVTASQVDHIGCASPYNEVAQFFNEKLNQTVVQLREELPDVAITYVDVYTVMYDLYNHASHYGFKKPMQSCNNGYGKVFRKDPSDAINWDGVHYTEAGNKWVFDKIVDGAYSNPPNVLNMACHRG